jgi:hypothetical protein
VRAIFPSEYDSYTLHGCAMLTSALTMCFVNCWPAYHGSGRKMNKFRTKAPGALPLASHGYADGRPRRWAIFSELAEYNRATGVPRQLAEATGRGGCGRTAGDSRRKEMRMGNCRCTVLFGLDQLEGLAELLNRGPRSAAFRLAAEKLAQRA